MKKKILISIAIFIIIIGAAVFVLIDPFSWFYRPSEQQKMFMENINASNSIVMYYGDLDPKKEITINYKKVSEFTDETIGDAENQYVYHTIVIFDFDGKMDISNEELILIKDYCENKHYDMIYYGNKHIEQFKQCGYFEVIDSDIEGFTYNGSYWMNRELGEEWLNPYLVLGNWSKEDSKDYDTSDAHWMWKFVVMEVESLIKDSQNVEAEL